MGMHALGIGEGDEVIMADTNWVATAAPIVHLGSAGFCGYSAGQLVFRSGKSRGLRLPLRPKQLLRSISMGTSAIWKPC